MNEVMERKEHEVQYIAVARIIPTRDNPRRVDVKAASFKDLVASIKARGILVPLLGRPDPKRPEMIDLRAGSRRFAAGMAAGFETVPVIVREMTDEEAMEVTVLENLQREGLSPMEEARGIAGLRAINKSDVDIAEKIGKSPAWVRRRAQLLNLAPKIAEEWEAGEDYRMQGATVAAMEVLASFDHVIQAQIFKAAGGAEFSDAAAFRKEIEQRYLNLLAAAPWELTDGFLDEKAGACTTCPKRSSQEALLFHDVLDHHEALKCDRCLDANCFAGKMKAHLANVEREARREHPKLVKVSTQSIYEIDYSDRQELEKKGVKLKEAWAKAKPNEKGAVPALVVSGPGAGAGVIWIKDPPSQGLRRDESAGESSARPSKTLEEKRVVLEGRRLIRAMQGVSASLEASIHPAADSTVGHLARLVSIFGARMPHAVFEGMDYDAGEWPALKQELKIDDFGLVKRLWAMVKPVLQGYLNVQAGPGHIGQHAADYAAKAAGICGLIGKDWKACLAAAVEEIPKPKGWARVEAAPAAEPAAAGKKPGKPVKSKRAKAGKRGRRE